MSEYEKQQLEDQLHRAITALTKTYMVAIMQDTVGEDILMEALDEARSVLEEYNQQQQ